MAGASSAGFFFGRPSARSGRSGRWHGHPHVRCDGRRRPSGPPRLCHYNSHPVRPPRAVHLRACSMVPHLVTALNGPLPDLEQQMLDATPAIERWFRLEWQEHTPPFYCSVDLRNAGFKLAPVDTNLFPGGFNNLAAEVLPLAVQAAMAAIEKICPDARNLLLIPENHTRNRVLPAERRAARGDPASDRTQRAARLAEPRDHRADHDRARRTARSSCSSRCERIGPTAGARAEEFRSVRDAAQQRPVGRHSADVLKGSARAVRAAAAACGLGRAPQIDASFRVPTTTSRRSSRS